MNCTVGGKIPMSLETLGPRRFTRFVRRYRRADLVPLLNLDSRYRALAVRIMLYRAFSVIVAIASTVFLVWLDSALVLILALIALLSVLPLWRTNKAASRYTLEFEGPASALAHETNRVIRSIMREVTSEAREPSDAKAAYGDEAVRRNIEAFEGGWLVLDQTQLINSTVFSIGLLVLLVFVGYEVAIRGAPLTNILLYVAVLRTCMGPLKMCWCW